MYRSPNAIILMMGTPGEVPLVLGNTHKGWAPQMVVYIQDTAHLAWVISGSENRKEASIVLHRVKS